MSSGSDSDEDFVPGEPEKLSEEESADDETDLQYEQELEHKAQKRKAIQEVPVTKKRKTKGEVKQIEKTPEEQFEEQRQPGEEKKHEEDLWAKFLEGTDKKPKDSPSNSNEADETSTVETTVSTKTPQTETNDVKKDTDEKPKERKIFEFAGETIVVEDNVIKEKIKNTDLPAAAANVEEVSSSSRGRGGGLSSVLGQINRKNKLSTLDKSKLDWETYKKQEGIEDEVKSDNKSKKGYLDRQDFLERADLRQYEIERELRMSRRSKR